jgi:two-component system NtrC family response regulator
VIFHALQVGHLPRAEIVEDNHPLPVANETFRKIASDKTGAAGDEYLQDDPPSALKMCPLSSVRRLYVFDDALQALSRFSPKEVGEPTPSRAAQRQVFIFLIVENGCDIISAGVRGLACPTKTTHHRTGMRVQRDIMVKPKLLIVDDDESILKQLKWAFDDDYTVFLASDKETALGSLREHQPDLVALDLGLSPHMGGEADDEGMEILARALKQDPLVKTIMITGNEDKEHAIKAIKMGAYDYYLKPVEVEELRLIMKRARRIQNLERENVRLQEQMHQRKRYAGLVGWSPAMQAVYQQIEGVADSDVTVLIEGESGTGKELVAKAIQEKSARAKGPFVIINCGAIPENLLESELFGHEKGAFTGATAAKAGKFEQADGGTLFLDEIGELPLSLQVKLLRFLQDHQIERVGGKHPIKLDVRVLAATNRDLEQEADAGRFRKDLYFRLNVVRIVLPLLKARTGDAMLLAHYFLDCYRGEQKKKISGFTAEAELAVKTAEWKGNVRELENRIRKALIVTNGHLITEHDLGLAYDEDTVPLPLKEAREQLDRKYIVLALRSTGGNISKAAKELGISRVTLHDLIKKYDITVPSPD